MTLSPKRRQPSFRLDPRAYPMTAPQFACFDGTLYFGRVALGALTAVESEMLNACDGSRSFGDLLARPGVDAQGVARIAPALLWWDRPVVAPTHRPVQRVVFSPAPEDAWLAMGGRILTEASERSTLVV